MFTSLSLASNFLLWEEMMESMLGVQQYDSLMLLLLNNLPIKVPLGKCFVMRFLNTAVRLVDTFRLNGGLNQSVFLCLFFLALGSAGFWNFMSSLQGLRK